MFYKSRLAIPFEINLTSTKRLMELAAGRMLGLTLQNSPTVYADTWSKLPGISQGIESCRRKS